MQSLGLEVKVLVMILVLKKNLDYITGQYASVVSATGNLSIELED